MGKVGFEIVKEFEEKIAKFFGAPYAIAVDSCTHGIELCLRYTGVDYIIVPKRTYLSIPFLAYKLNLDLGWSDGEWTDYYYLTGNIIDAAVLWRKNSYIPYTFMSISFQYQKHLSLGRGGMILTDNEWAYDELKKMSYDGRIPGVPWREQDISTIGYHYYMTVETAAMGLQKINDAINTVPRRWVITDWPDLTQMKVFKHE